MEGIKLVENKILESIRKSYTQNIVRFTTDPEANDIISIELFDIPDAECRAVKKFLWKVIEENCPGNIYSFVPAVYSHSKTVEFYSNYCVNPNPGALEDCADYNGVLPESIMTILVTAGGNCSHVHLDAPTFDANPIIHAADVTRQFIEELDIEKEVCTDVHDCLAA